MKNNGRKAALHNLGCKVNSYETEAMQQELEGAGYTIVPFDQQADVYVINTCSVTNVADRKSRQMLHKAKKMNPDAVIVAAGCYVNTAKEKTGLAVDADLIVGNNRKKDLANLLEQYFTGTDLANEPAADNGSHVLEDVPDVNKGEESKIYENLQISKTSEHTRAYIKVQDGCNQFCSYCIIPFARGRIRSRDRLDVVNEIKTLAQSGIQEVVLTGIHLSSYGKDQDVDTDLLDLILRVAEVEGISRIRLGSLEQGIITEEFAKRLAREEKFCPHFHLSLQSGCDTVLERMNRQYNTEVFAHRCDILRSEFKDPALTTDIIVGFPGETEQEFAETKAFLEKIKFYETHIFRYSMREGTIAARMKEQIPEPIKVERSNVLQALNKVNQEAFLLRREGQRETVLFEEPVTIEGNEYFSGYTKDYVKALVKADSDYRNVMLEGTLTRNGAPDGAMLFTM